MASTRTAQVITLGDIAYARGRLGPAHSHATSDQIRLVTELVTASSSYRARLESCVICVEDRLDVNGYRKHAARLAGGALSLALMYNFYLFLIGAKVEGRRLSDDLRALHELGLYLVLHDDCGALKLVANVIKGFVPQDGKGEFKGLADMHAEGYKLLAAIGRNVTPKVREDIAAWAKRFPKNYVDVSPRQALEMGIIDEVEHIVDEHNAVIAAVSLADGESFTAGPELDERAGGLKAFAFDVWAALRAAHRITVSREHAGATDALALVFTAQVFLVLGGPDLLVSVHR